MAKIWFEIRLQVSPESVEPVTGLLHEVGCVGVTVEDRALDTFVPPDPDAPYTGGTLSAYFEGGEGEVWLSQVRQALGTVPGVTLPGPGDVCPVQQEDWAEGWKQHFPPIQVGEELLILPTWEEVPSNPPPHLLRLDPGMAFGTGTHATTALCLEAIVFAHRDAPLTRVLDVGTGSGILAMAAAELGCPEVLGCDIEPESCRVARENCRLNGLEGRVTITDDDLSDLPEGYDLVVANILAEENVRLADEMVRRVAPGGWLILSGILREKESLVVRGFSRFPLSEPAVRYRDDWVCLSYRRAR